VKVCVGETGGVTNSYLQVSQAFGIARPEYKAMLSAKGKSKNVWANQVLQQMAEQRESEMQGMMVAKQKATRDAGDTKADQAAKHKETQQLREAQETRSVQESSRTLSLDSQWRAAAQKWIADGTLLEKIIACAHLKGVKCKHDEVQDVIFMAVSALVTGKKLRAAVIRTLETKTSPPYVLLLGPVANVVVPPTVLER